MKRSSERFLTTHTGSLPRPADLIQMMFAREEGVPVDPAALAARVRAAVDEIVRKQVEAGLDVVNDGEMSKPSYATYIKDRLHGDACSATPAARAARPRPATGRSASATRALRRPMRRSSAPLWRARRRRRVFSPRRRRG